ncbi:PspC domain-containing protein [Telluria aromaticivorans]|uniref:PspC domain-containing protein n=1 Tax=Telluria aromaticivorans TaxID=2725995 RepID=A0A7Y2JWP5_9BURK|nr:PspC domain-containing protein [Telluria aromaticivorans]NNG22295.1 PspC domain-containing protein [Telluria aromaticivorans]
MNLSDEIKRLHELHQAGALSDAEFEQAKARVLSSANLTSPGVNLGKGDGTLTGELGTLRRSRTDRWLGGVCGGLAQVSGVDSWVWRLVFALFTLTFGFGIAIYLLLWIFVPEE